MGKTCDRVSRNVVMVEDEYFVGNLFHRIIDWVYEVFTKERRVHYVPMDFTKLRRPDGKMIYVTGDIVERSFDNLLTRYKNSLKEAK